MTIEFTLPDLGEGVREAEILSIAVAPGQQIAEGDPLLEVETDKAAVAIPSPFTGTVGDILVSVGDTPRVGDILVTFNTNKIARKRAPVPAAPSTRRLARELGVNLHAVTPTGRNGIVTAEDVRGSAAAGTASLPTPPTQPGKEETVSEEQLADFSRWGEIERLPFRSIRKKNSGQNGGIVVENPPCQLSGPCRRHPARKVQAKAQDGN